MKEVKEEIQELIDLKAEGDYWDFKQKWHSNISDLLHDIINFKRGRYRHKTIFPSFEIDNKTLQISLTSKLGVAIMMMPSLLCKYILGGFHYEQG
ncbi:hypothetical protein [[Eubacterium] hominis]|uniref:hypothetical protein n=1 Tax=[Eubacterium] hominis TaxID=2764325 RepID=UPI003A4E322A